MDLAGVAALLGVPVAFAAVLVPLLADGRPLRRLERIEHVLAGTQLTGARRKVFEDARDDLAVLVAFSVVVPRMLWMLVWGSVEIAWGSASMIVALGVPGGVDLMILTLDNSPAAFWTGAWNAALGIWLLVWRYVLRRRIWKDLGRGVQLP